MKSFPFLVLLMSALLFGSCDLSDKEYFIYQNTEADGANDRCYISWEDGDCLVMLKDSSDRFDNYNIYFPSDQSNIGGEIEAFHRLEKRQYADSSDSIKVSYVELDIADTDPRIQDNPFVILKLLEDQSVVFEDTLFREYVKESWRDRGTASVHF